MIRITSRRNKRLATSAVEFALVAPLFFMFFLCIIEYARYLFVVQLLNNAAREGARFAVVNTQTATASSVQTYVNNYLAGMGPNCLQSYSATSNISVYQASLSTGLSTGSAWASTGWGTAIGVSISGTYQPLVPALSKLGGNFPIKCSCVMTTEANNS